MIRSPITTLFVPAWRNFVRNLRRYRIVLAALVLIVAVLISVLGTLLGLYSSVREKASRYFAGDLVVLGLSGRGRSVIEEPDIVESAITDIDTEGLVRAWSRRSTYYELGNIELFFVGYYARLRRLVGVEWQRERPVLASFLLSEGNIPDNDDEDGILISSATARSLNIRAGDGVLVSVISDRGRSNTVDLIVRGIYTESSFFGYTGYLHRRTLNRLREVPDDTINEMGVYLYPSMTANDEGEIAERLTDGLRRRGLSTFPVLTDREAYEHATAVAREGPQHGVVTLSAQLAEITELLRAISIVAGVLIMFFLGIVVVGVRNTWTMVVWERTSEIGTLRALGMQRAGTVSLFLLEALFLGLVGVILGTTVGVALLFSIARMVEFPPNAATTLFLTQGRLSWRLPGWAIGSTTVLAIGASVIGALHAAIRAGRVLPAEALRRGR